jgi:hypothetical protein
VNRGSVHPHFLNAGCKKVTFSISTVTLLPPPPPPATGSTPIHELYTTPAASAQDCALRCYASNECVFVTVRPSNIEVGI